MLSKQDKILSNHSNFNGDRDIDRSNVADSKLDPIITEHLENVKRKVILSQSNDWKFEEAIDPSRIKYAKFYIEEGARADIKDIAFKGDFSKDYDVVIAYRADYIESYYDTDFDLNGIRKSGDLSKFPQRNSKCDDYYEIYLLPKTDQLEIANRDKVLLVKGEQARDMFWKLWRKFLEEDRYALKER